MTEILPLNYTDPLVTEKPNNVYKFKKSASFKALYGLGGSQYEAEKPWEQPIHHGSVSELIEAKVKSPIRDIDAEDAFFVADLGELARQHVQFKTFLPRVEPFYAVKCNPDPMVIRSLKALGTGFDCASKAEIQMVLDQGVPASKIIYANPCKQASHIKYAQANGVTMMTFDNTDELAKIKEFYPEAQLVLRILTDDSKSLCKLGTKFGASLQNVALILKTAKELEMNVIGISFHVGSGCFDAQAFGDAVVRAKKAFEIGQELGFEFTLLDLGGGFPGQNMPGVQFVDIARILNDALETCFPPESNIRLIAEPGRYYVSSAYTLVVNVVARRTVPATEESPASFMYYINDGMYGSFNCLTFDHATVTAKPLVMNGQFLYNQTVEAPVAHCSIWGPTCDSIDCIGKDVLLPVMNIGDYMYFENMGAYTMCAASQFNGFKKSSILYTNTEVGLEALLE